MLICIEHYLKSINYMLSQNGRKETLSHKRRAVVLGSVELLTASVVSLLHTETDFEVIQATFAELSGMDTLASMQPDLVILDATEIIAYLPESLKFIKECPEVRLVVLTNDDNEIRVIDRQVVEIKHVRDFLELL